MKSWVGLSVTAILLISSSSSSATTERCRQISQQLKAELDATHNRLAKERAAIAVLERPFNALIQRQDRGEITADQYRDEAEKWRKAEDCINAENNLQVSKAYYVEEAKAREASCEKGPISKWIVDSVKEKEQRRSKACGQADLQTVAGIVRRLSEIIAERASKEEHETLPVKKADLTYKTSDFCKQVNSVAVLASSQFRSIIGRKTDKSFLPGIKISEMVGIDAFETSASLDLPALSVPARCEIEVGNEHDTMPIGLRLGLQYTCQWEYKQINLRDLEEKTDLLFNAVRACFEEVTESETKTFRHDFTANKSIEVNGKLYYGEKNPSTISFSLSRYAPEEDQACTRYSFNNSSADKELCMKKFRH